MGNCFSDPSSSAKKGAGQRLGSGPASTGNTSTAPPPGSNAKQNHAPPQRLGGGEPATPGGIAGVEDGDARDRALRAAEERAKAAGVKGVNTSNPKAGQLSKKLADERKVTPTSPQVDERMMDRGQWN